MTINPVKIHTRDEHVALLAEYLPGGKVFAGSGVQTSNVYKLLHAFARTLKEAEEYLSLYFGDYDFRQSTAYLAEWEAALGIPDECFTAKRSTLTTAERQRDILAKWLMPGVQTQQDFIDMAAIFGVNATVTPGIDYIGANGFFTYNFTFNLAPNNQPSQQDARFTIYVGFGLDAGENSTFTYEFTFNFASSIIDILKCVFERLVPANVQIIYV